MNSLRLAGEQLRRRNAQPPEAPAPSPKKRPPKRTSALPRESAHEDKSEKAYKLMMVQVGKIALEQLSSRSFDSNELGKALRHAIALSEVAFGKEATAEAVRRHNLGHYAK